jgi:hypothetical protein
MFNTLKSNDNAKVVAIDKACFGSEWASTNLPYGVSSDHVGLETTQSVVGNTATEAAALMKIGSDNLGPSDLAATDKARFEVTLPYTSNVRTYYKVCYKLKNGDFPWVEVQHAPLANQVYATGTDQFKTYDASLSTFTVNSAILGQEPFTSAVYASGIAYSAGILGGIATGVVGSSSNTSYLYVTHTSSWTDYAKDTFKLVLFSNEVTRGTYTNLPDVNCRRPGVEERLAATGFGSSTTPAFVTNMPTQGGRYLLCYKKYGVDLWFQLDPASTTYGNPFKVIPSRLSFDRVGTGNFTINDYFSEIYSSAETALGAVNMNDKIYIVNSTDVCGVSHSWEYDLTNPGSTASRAATLDTAPKKFVHNMPNLQCFSRRFPHCTNCPKLVQGLLQTHWNHDNGNRCRCHHSKTFHPDWLVLGG